MTFDKSMLPMTVPGYAELNSFKLYTLYGKDGKPGVLGLDAASQDRISGHTYNPYARSVEHQELWDGYFKVLVAAGYAGRDLYWRSMHQLLIMYWEVM